MSKQVSAQSSIEAAILDLDGTVYCGDQLVPGASQTISSMREAGIRVLFLTNKPLRRREHYSEKLSSLGVPATPGDVITSGWVTARYLREHHPSRRAFVIGEEMLFRELEASGIETTADSPGEMLVVSMDRTFTYDKLDLAMRTLDRDVPFIATNSDRTCPTAEGEIPDTAGMIGAVAGVTQRQPDAILGKPSATMLDTIRDAWDVDPTRCVMVGDRPETDIEMGERAGMTTALVLSGVTDRSEVAGLDVEPDCVIDSVGELPAILGPPVAVTDE